MTGYRILLALIALIAYLMGSLRSTVIASNFIFHRSLARLGKGNVWLSNFRRIYGVPGFLKLGLVELVKDVLPILLGGWLLGIKGHPAEGRAFAAFCLMMGTLYPVFYRFKGSNGAICLVIAAFFADFSVGLTALLVAALVTWFSRYTSLGAATAALACAGVTVLTVDGRLLIELYAFTALLVLLRQLPALLRVFTGREQKFSLREDLSYKFDEKF